MNQKMIGQNIKKIREKFGFSQEEVEKSLGLPQKAMTRIEAAQSNVSSLELTNLAEFFHCPITFFFLEEGVEEDLLVALYCLCPG
jgi:transcriptional regulator with XRE-family HTH domain